MSEDDPQAVLYENALQQARDEFKMRVRVSLRSFATLWEMKRLLRPRFGRFAYQLLVHKWLRYFVPWFLVLLLTANLFLLDDPLFQVTLGSQALFYLIALLGWPLERLAGKGPLTFPFYFVLLNIAAAAAFLRFLAGERITTWRPRGGS